MGHHADRRWCAAGLSVMQSRDSNPARRSLHDHRIDQAAARTRYFRRSAHGSGVEASHRSGEQQNRWARAAITRKRPPATRRHQTPPTAPRVSLPQRSSGATKTGRRDVRRDAEQEEKMILGRLGRYKSFARSVVARTSCVRLSGEVEHQQDRVVDPTQLVVREVAHVLT